MRRTKDFIVQKKSQKPSLSSSRMIKWATKMLNKSKDLQKIILYSQVWRVLDRITTQKGVCFTP